MNLLAAAPEKSFQKYFMKQEENAQRTKCSSHGKNTPYTVLGWPKYKKVTFLKRKKAIELRCGNRYRSFLQLNINTKG